MLDPTFQLAKVTGSKEPHGDNMWSIDSVERMHQSDPLKDSVFAKIHEIIGPEEIVIPKNTAVRHVSVEEAIKELLSVEASSAQSSPSALQ
jgi:hypothetical protein